MIIVVFSHTQHHRRPHRLLLSCLAAAPWLLRGVVCAADPARRGRAAGVVVVVARWCSWRAAARWAVAAPLPLPPRPLLSERATLCVSQHTTPRGRRIIFAAPPRSSLAPPRSATTTAPCCYYSGGSSRPCVTPLPPFEQEEQFCTGNSTHPAPPVFLLSIILQKRLTSSRIAPC